MLTLTLFAEMCKSDPIGSGILIALFILVALMLVVLTIGLWPVSGILTAGIFTLWLIGYAIAKMLGRLAP